MPVKTLSKNTCVAVLLDSYNLGGSAKVVLQNLRYSSADLRLIPILFKRGKSPQTELELKLKAEGFEFEVVFEFCAFDPLLLFRLIKILRLRQAQLIESNHYKTHVLALLSSFILHLPWVAVSHGWTAENIKIRLYNLLDRLTLPFATVCIAMGPTILERLKKILPQRNKLRCFPTALDPKELSHSDSVMDIKKDLGITSEQYVFGAIGRLSAEKGFDVLLHACTLLTREINNFVVLLIGSGHEEIRLKEVAKKYGIEKHIRFLGQKSSDEIFWYYKIFDSLVIPSRSEGMPNVLLEAAWCKVPVIATNVGGISDFMTAELTEWICNSGDSKQLAEKMKELAGVSNERHNEIANKLNSCLQGKYLAPERARNVCELYKAVIKPSN